MAHQLIVLLVLATSIADTLAQGGPGGFGGGQGGFGGGQGGFGGGQGGFGGGQGGFGGGQGGFGGGQGGLGDGQGGFGGGQGGFGGGPGGFGGGQGGFGGGQGGFGDGQGGFGGPGGFGGGPGGFGGGPGSFGGGPGGLNGLFGGQGGFPGGLPGGFPGMFPNFGQSGFQQAQILTCIGSNEAYDLMKVTVSPEQNANMPVPQTGQQREFLTQTWRISAVYIPSGSVGRLNPQGTASLVGQFYLAVTRYGRTDGSCAGLGGILQNEDTINRANAFQQNPYFQAMSSQQPAGRIPDPMVIGPGGNVYSGVLRDVSEADLRGRGMSVCIDAMCTRPTTMCCTIAKDSATATDQLGSITGTTGFSPNAGTQGLAGVGGLLTGSPAGRPGGNGLSSSSSGLF